jgi:hypothetical protein
MLTPKAALDPLTQWIKHYYTKNVEVKLDSWRFTDCINDLCKNLLLDTSKKIDPYGDMELGNNVNTASNGGVAVNYHLDFARFLTKGATMSLSSMSTW